jgi:hypothetical protein
MGVRWVRHRLLLEKMSTNVEPSHCPWLGSYFFGRIQRVKMGDCVSRDILVTGQPFVATLFHLACV